MESILIDVRHGMRSLAARPGFTAFAVLAFALGIGATTTVLSLVISLVLHPVPFRDLDRIVEVWETSPKTGAQRHLVSPADFADLRDHVGAFEQVEAFQDWSATVTGSGEPQRLRGFLVTPGLFSLLGIDVASGRGFSPEEAQRGQERVVVVSHGFWQQSLGADPRVVGQSLRLDDRQVTVVGVVPAGYDFPLGADLWAPLALSPGERSERATHRLRVLGRMRAGTSLTQARSEVSVLADRLRALHPEADGGKGMELLPLRQRINFGTRQFVLFLMGAAGFVLLLACANVAGLQIARGAERQKEIAIRMSLGGTRSRIIRQLLTESAILSLLGGALGVLLALWGIDLMKTTVPPWVAKYVVAGLQNVGVDGWALAYTTAAALVSGTLAALTPALHLSRPELADALRVTGGSSAPGIRSGRARNLLVVVEVALALVLLVGAGLMVKGFRHLLHVNRGFETTNLMTLRITPPESRYPELHHVAAFHDRILRRLEASPDVEAVCVVDSLPAVGRRSSDEVVIEGHPQSQPGEPPRADVQVVSESCFTALRIPVLEGRAFTREDASGASPVAVVSDSMARRFWPDEQPVGRRFRLGAGRDGQAWLTVVGVVGDVSRDWIENSVTPTAYLPHGQSPRRSMAVAIRTRRDPDRAASEAVAGVRALDTDQPVEDLKSMERILGELSSGVRLSAGMMGLFAMIALFLSLTGIYAIVSQLVAQRTREIGLRVALGAQRRDILRLFVRHGLTLAGIGIGIALPAAVGLTWVMSTFLMGIISIHAGILVALALGMLSVCALASYIPARSASAMDAMDALRCE